MAHRFAAVWTLVRLLGAHAASISNCGGPEDIFTVSQLSVSPDPIRHREPFTITAIGKLGKAFSGGTVSYNVDVSIQVLTLKVDTNVKNVSMVELAPAVPEGDFKLVVGPLELPRLPGHLGVAGRVTIVDEEGAAVACVALDLRTPLGSEVARFEDPQEPAELQAPASCGKQGDHLTDISFSEEGGWDVTTATFDEAITKARTDVAVKLFLGRLPLLLKMSVPVLYEPGIAEGEFKVKSKQVGPSAPAADALPVRVVGEVVVLDGEGEEITCVAIDSKPLGGAAHEQAVVV